MERGLARSRDRQPAPAPTQRRIRLMIVDDSTVARAVLSRMVESDPAFEITAVAGTAEDAIEALGECRVDVVILDLDPGMHSLAILEAVADNAFAPPVIALTSMEESEMTPLATRHGSRSGPVLLYAASLTTHQAEAA